MLLENRVVFAENIHVSILTKKWLSDEEAANRADNIEFITYLSILSTLGKSN